MSLDIDGQYDKIYRYCYFKLHNRSLAEDFTQETFLRYLEHYGYATFPSSLQYLYTIARHLCVDEYRRPKTEPLCDSTPDCAWEEKLAISLDVRSALAQLSPDEQELLFLRYVNEVPVSTLAKLHGQSRFAVYRRITAASNKFRSTLQKEDLHE